MKRREDGAVREVMKELLRSDLRFHKTDCGRFGAMTAWGLKDTRIKPPRLNDYLADIEEQAQERFERIVEQMKQAQGITEQLKADDTLEWIGRMSNIQACAREIVDKEMIYQ